MQVIKVKVIYDNHIDINDVEINLINDIKCVMTVRITNEYKITAEGEDFFECFKKVRGLDKAITYYCKGAKINVLPSRMTRQMTKGLTAYETSLGAPARKENLVNIFDYEDKNLASDPIEQDEYEAKWFLSLNN
ncbi:hypothetical protein [Erwinia phyllosphaerae]|uniref:hypothetical protein n=1 Tax=Erwinia phyllosphaerae TaxID=2853256 RepID=UPI001FEE2924|nr:hypothetical protein [Erwinia phyllosphaerae]